MNFVGAELGSTFYQKKFWLVRDKPLSCQQCGFLKSGGNVILNNFQRKGTAYYLDDDNLEEDGQVEREEESTGREEEEDL